VTTPVKHQATTVDIRPDVGVLGVFASVNYKAWYAIAEFVDNALHSFLTNRDLLANADQGARRLRVAIALDSHDGGCLTVWDDAAGISSARFRDAFAPARAPQQASGLSRYGMGSRPPALPPGPAW
jgi:Histidine kinase-, DNA gyrase B-, and HSP90-like ATPase